MGTKKIIEPIKVDYIEIWAYLMGIYLTWKVADKEFRIKFQEEIENWLLYRDRKRFEKMITRMIRQEMKKFHVTPEEIEKIIKSVIERPKFKIIDSMDLLSLPVCPHPLRD